MHQFQKLLQRDCSRHGVGRVPDDAGFGVDGVFGVDDDFEFLLLAWWVRVVIVNLVLKGNLERAWEEGGVLF